MGKKLEIKDGVSINDFIVLQKIQAFTDAYEPAGEEGFNTYSFDDRKLREFFKAYPIPSVGDPLSAYIDSLEMYGFTLNIGLSGEPVIIVKDRIS